MKKIILGAAVTMSMLATSCGGGTPADVDNDTIFSRELSDSISETMGAFYGATLQYQTANMASIDEFIEGYQLIAGHQYTDDQINGITTALQLVRQIQALEAEGIEINRDLLLREFRKYIQRENMDDMEFAQLYDQAEKLNKRMSTIIERREVLRGNIPATETIMTETPEQPAPVDSIAVEEIVEAETIVTAEQPDSTASNQ